VIRPFKLLYNPFEASLDACTQPRDFFEKKSFLFLLYYIYCFAYISTLISGRCCTGSKLLPVAMLCTLSLWRFVIRDALLMDRPSTLFLSRSSSRQKIITSRSRNGKRPKPERCATIIQYYRSRTSSTDVITQKGIMKIRERRRRAHVPLLTTLPGSQVTGVLIINR
jgi:hypothetical protein